MSDPDSMWKKIATPKIKNDVYKFWTEYREENGIGDNIILVLINTDRALMLELNRIVNLFVDIVLRQREYEGTSILQPKDDEVLEEIYPMTDKRKEIQMDCRNTDCQYYRSDGDCDNPAPAISLNPNKTYTCWSKKES